MCSSDLKGNFNHVAGDLEIRKTGINNGYCMVDGSDKIQIDGSLILTGGEFKGVCSTSKDKLELGISKNLVLNGGYFSDADLLKNDGSTWLTVSGDVVLLAGTFNMTRGSNSFLKLENGSISKWIQKTQSNVVLGDVIVEIGRAHV